MYKILFVCTGNICRSPTAEGILRTQAAQRGIPLHIDSAGTHGYHIGETPDARSVAHAKKRGVDISNLRARKVTLADFEAFDVILALDNGHLHQLQLMRPRTAKAKLELFLGDTDVPDPYYGTAKDFEHVLDLVEAGAEKWLKQIKP